MSATGIEATPWRGGDRVHLRGRVWQIRQITRGSDCTALALAAVGSAQQLTVLLPFDRPRAAAPPATAIVSRRRWRHRLASLDASCRRFGELDSTARHRLDLLPYQLEPALVILQTGASRLLLTDAVGLGKTIQAAVALAELSARNVEFRALIIVPAGLRAQWRQELAARFAVGADVADAAWLHEAAGSLPPDVNPWARPGTLVTSMDFVKRPEVLSALSHLIWDLVVVDEAHLASVSTDRRAALDMVCRRAAHIMLLTATPHPGNTEALRALCDIGRLPGEPPPLRFDRRCPPAVARAARRSRFQRIRLSADEHHVHRLLAEYLTAVQSRAAASPGGADVRLLVTTLRKRALSGPAALALSLARRIAVLRTWTSPAPAPSQPELPLDDDDGAMWAPPILGTAAREIRWLGGVAEAARRACRDDRKRAWLRRLTRRVAEPVLVFTEYRDTLEHLAAKLPLGPHRLLTLHGGMDAAERTRVLAAFDAGSHVLLATDVAAEGLNLQRRCRLVIHFELPWSLTRLIQRAGRVDRLGQTRRVHEIALVADDTAERLVLLPLARRAVAEAQAGHSLPLLPEREVAALMGGAESPSPPTAAASFTQSPPRALEDVACREAWRLARAREMARSQPERRRSSGLVACRIISPGTRRTLVYLVLRVKCVDPGLNPVHAELVVLELRMTHGFAPPRTSRRLRSLCGSLRAACSGRTPPLGQAVEGAEQAVLRRVAARQAVRADARRARLEAVATTMTSSVRPPLQPGLFDARAVRAAAAQAESAAASAAELARRLSSDATDALEVFSDLWAVLVVAPPGQ